MKNSNGTPLKRKKYETELRKLQAGLCQVQEWVKHKGLRVVVIFEGRDAAGKGGTIKAITERVSPRVFRPVALPAPSDREKSMIYFQRYMSHLPAAGEIVIFDRSWYNRAGVEHVMGFCSKEEYRRFLDLTPVVEKYLVDGGVQLIKFWLEVGDKEQKRRFEARINDPIRQWKLSSMDLPSRSKWWLNCIAHLVSLIPHKKLSQSKVKLSKRSMKGAYDDQAALKGRKFVPEKY